MSKNLLITLAVAACVLTVFMLNHPVEESNEFQAFKKQFNMQFTSAEQSFRKVIFYANLKKFEEHNADPSQTYKLGVTQFSALTQDQFVQTYLNPRQIVSEVKPEDLIIPEVTEDIDWTEKDMVSPVKSQGNCASGWAFSAVASLESLALSKNQTVYLSEQQLMDCSMSYGNLGCHDGDNYEGLNYVKDHGIQTEDAYPYIAKVQKCKVQGGSFKIAGWHYAKGCKQVLAAILQQPMGVSVSATNWPNYKSGLFSNCDENNINHDTFLVGATSTYWKIKNSWGTSWGEQGFIRLRHANNCGLCVDKSPWAI